MELNELVKKAREKGIDVEDVLLMLISKEDPSEGASIRLGIAEKFLNEAEEYMKKGDPVQASEKAYKVAEEVVKALAEEFRLPEHEEALREGRWTAYSIGRAANRLSERLGMWVVNGWSDAFYLHVWGFHERKLSVDDIKQYFEGVKEMFIEAKKVLKGDH